MKGVGRYFHGIGHPASEAGAEEHDQGDCETEHKTTPFPRDIRVRQSALVYQGPWRRAITFFVFFALTWLLGTGRNLALNTFGTMEEIGFRYFQKSEEESV